jgi:hypothetical protein
LVGSSDRPNDPVLFALFSIVAVLALRLSQGSHIPVPVTAWYHKAEPTFVDCLALVHRHLWRIRDQVFTAYDTAVTAVNEALRQQPMSLADGGVAVPVPPPDPPTPAQPRAA